jgi:RHS repeat-associated protein
MSRRYTYDGESNITGITTEQGENQYSYDTLYRLTQVDTAIPGLPEEHYTYDPLGNRLTDTRKPNPGQADKSWTYNENNQLLQSATDDTGLIFTNSQAVTHVYDDNGSLTKKSTPAGTENQYPTDNQSYTYDASNRLIEVKDKDNQLIASYQYDPFGRRIRKTVHRSWNGSEWTPIPQKETHTYFYSDEGLAAEYIQDGAGAALQGSPRLIAEYGWEPDGLWGTNPVWIRTRRNGQASNESNEPDLETFFYQNDHLGTPQQILDQAGDIVWSQKSTAFGETTVAETSTIENNLRFPGQYFDSETITHYNFFRDYSPKMGRYWQGDPIGLGGGINIYGYVEADPLNYVDPTGEFLIGGAIGSAGFSIGMQVLICKGFGGDFSTCFKCIDWTDVAVSFGMGFLFPGWIGDVGKPLFKARRKLAVFGGQGLGPVGPVLKDNAKGAAIGTGMGWETKWLLNHRERDEDECAHQDECARYRLGGGLNNFFTSIQLF